MHSDNSKDVIHPVDRHVGRRIRMKRLLLNFGQKQVAAALGVSFQQVQKYENGSNRISASRLYDVGRVLGEPVDFFFVDAEKLVEDCPVDFPLPSTIQAGDDVMQRTETLELIRYYWSLPNHDVRRKFLGLVKSMDQDFFTDKADGEDAGF